MFSAVCPSFAQTSLYWDLNGNTTGAGTTPNGTWNGTTKNWSQVSGGNNTVDVWQSGFAAVFSAGTDATGAYTVTVSGTRSAASITIQDGTPTFTGGTLNFSGASPTLTINSGRTLNWGSTGLTSATSTLNKAGTGTLNFTQNLNFAGTANFAGGTLQLTSAALTLTTLNITGNTILDFSGTASSLNLTNFSISAGVTLTIQNWSAANDFFYTTNWTGATPDVMGSTPMNQVTFSGFTANQTGWDSFDNRIRPNVPEPAAYGAILLGSLTALACWRRRPAA